MTRLTSIRGRYLFVLDLIAIAGSIVGAMVLRFDTLRLSEHAVLYFPAALFPLLIQPPVNVAFGLYSRAWIHASVGELTRISLAVLAGTGLGAVFFYGNGIGKRNTVEGMRIVDCPPAPDM